MAYMCLTVDTAGSVFATTVTTATDCTTYIAVSADTFVTQPTLQDIFNVPIASDMLQMWELGFGLPVLCYLVAWGYGTVINMFSRNH